MAVTNQFIIPQEEVQEMIKGMIICKTHLGGKGADKKMLTYIHERNELGHHLFLVDKTVEKIHLAARIIVAYSPGSICAVGARPMAMRPVLKFASYTNAVAAAGRWTPGTLTNQVTKQFMEPRVVIIADPSCDHQAIQECATAGIPVIALCNSDCRINNVDIVIPCNNRSAESLGLVFYYLAREVLRLRGEIARNEPWSVMMDMFIQKEVADVEKTVEEEGAEEGADADGVDAEANIHQDANQDWNTPANEGW